MSLALLEALVHAYRIELSKRYQKENAQRFPAFANFFTEKREETKLLTQFFLEYVYPPFSQRMKRDEALEAMLRMLKSPPKLWPLRSIALPSVRRLGWNLGSVLKAAFHSIEVYVRSLGLEKLMVKEAQRLFPDPAIITQNGSLSMRKIMAALPSQKVLHFQKEIFNLFSTLANSSLLEKIIESMHNSQNIMEKHPRIYSEKERAGLDHGIRMLEAAYVLFCKLDAKEVELVLQAIRLIEKDWYESCLRLKEN